ncbi:hypothetical protein ACQ4M4_18135 [Leptolyngbya sp. AN02str]|uniref:hypothetical protein n=1 Tax=Leptolyngbya sp. AN02str TaxID=3423363 RepID=UPI003D322AD4
MTGSRFRIDSPLDREASGSITMSEVLALPTEQRRVMVWLIRQGTVTLAEVAQRLTTSEANAQEVLNALLEQGYVQIIAPMAGVGPDTPLRYRAQTIQRQRAFATEQLVTPIPTPLAVILSGMGDGTATPGETVELSVTVTNKGDESAIIDIFLDDVATSLYAWVSSPQERLALGPDQSGEVVFRFQIPATALPGHHPYTVVVDAPQHYPTSPPLLFEESLQVLPSAYEQTQTGDPTLFLMPATRAGSPASLPPGGTLEVQVWVHNRSDRVDRFRLRCTDLPPEWLTVTYPQGFQQVGLTLAEQYLDLNPGEQGTILVLVLVPPGTLAGSYVGTLQLQSENQPHLALMDLLYLSVQPVYQVTFQFRTLVSRVQDQPGIFVVQASNHGNTPRLLQFQAMPLDGGDLCTYTLEPPQLSLQPRQTQTLRLLVQPNPPRKRPWLGGGRLLNFAVEAQDAEHHPLPDVPMQGFVMWESRPWWQLLPLVLLAVGAMATLVWLIWWALFRPPVVPRVVRLAPSDTEYFVANDDAVRLDFQVSDPHTVQSLEVVGLSTDGQIISNSVSYDVSQGLPPTLVPFCTLNRALLTCRNVLTDARQPGEYRFTLTAFPKPGRGSIAPATLTAAPVAIAPFPTPEILVFASSQPIYAEAPPPEPATPQARSPQSATAAQTSPNAAPSTSYGIRLNWAISHPERVAALQLVGRDPEGTVVMPAVVLNLRNGIPPELEPFCTIDTRLVCQNVQTGFRQAGSYIFELTVIPFDGPPQTPIAQTTPPIRIDARPPQILQFLVNGEPMQPKYLVPVDQDQLPPPVVVSWQVEANPGTTVALLPVPGNVAPQGSLPLPLSPQPSSTVITLQVTNRAGTQVNRSFTLETFDPTPGDPAAANGGAGAAGAAGSAAPPAPSEVPLTAPRPSQPGSLGPSELPPQF